MGKSYYYLFTVWREPGHELILERKTARACREYFGMGEKWDYFRLRIEQGQEPGYSLIKEKSTDLAKANRPKKGEDLNGFTKQMIWGEGQDIYMTCADGSIMKLCGSCKDWTKEDHRREDGKRYGVCKRSQEITERCAKCRFLNGGKTA